MHHLHSLKHADPVPHFSKQLNKQIALFGRILRLEKDYRLRNIS